MTKVNVFPDEMITDVRKAVTLFIKKPEKPIEVRMENDVALIKNMNIVTSYLLDKDIGSSPSLIGSLDQLQKRSGTKKYSFN